MDCSFLARFLQLCCYSKRAQNASQEARRQKPGEAEGQEPGARRQETRRQEPREARSQVAGEAAREEPGEAAGQVAGTQAEDQ